MTAAPSKPASATDDRALDIVRVFDAPRRLVFEAWTDPQQMAQWSAPDGYSITSSTGEARAGSAWRSCMRTPDGEDCWLGGTYLDVQPDSLIVFTHAWDGPDGRPGHETTVTVRFEDAGGKTRMHFHQAVFDSVESRDGHHGGWGQCFDLLAAHLAHPLAAQRRA